MSTREISYSQAVREGIAEEMRRDGSVICIGEDVGEPGNVFAVLTGLYDEFGAGRMIDSPISEAGIAGLGVDRADRHTPHR